jgi:hypothetical protein
MEAHHGKQPQRFGPGTPWGELGNRLLQQRTGPRWVTGVEVVLGQPDPALSGIRAEPDGQFE